MSARDALVPSSSQSPRVLRLGTRRSALAMAQAQLIARRIELAAKESHDDVVVELIGLSTEGDETSAPLSGLGGTGVFVSRLRRALLVGEIDAAVHSLKDLPTSPMPGILLAAVPEREDARDVLLSRGGARLEDLPDAARIGTGSPRRASQLRWRAAELGRAWDVVDIRGNVDTRIARTALDLDAVVLAHAGLIRLGRAEEVSEVLDPDVMLPAPGQGALGLECATENTWAASVLAKVNDPWARACVSAERTLLAVLEAGCAAPVGALANVMDGAEGLRLRAVVVQPDGQARISDQLQVVVPQTVDTVDADDTAGLAEIARELGTRLGQQMLAAGADRLIANAHGELRDDDVPDAAESDEAPSHAVVPNAGVRS